MSNLTYSPSLLWLITKNNNSSLAKSNGICLSKSGKNLMNLNSPKYSEVSNYNTYEISKEAGKKIKIVVVNHKKCGRPAKQVLLTSKSPKIFSQNIKKLIYGSRTGIVQVRFYVHSLIPFGLNVICPQSLRSPATAGYTIPVSLSPNPNRRRGAKPAADAPALLTSIQGV